MNIGEWFALFLIVITILFCAFMPSESTVRSRPEPTTDAPLPRKINKNQSDNI